MARLILVSGPTGVGKTTYSLKLAQDIDAIRFSIDPWMQTMFAKDMTELDYNWMIERVYRCYDQIWEVSQQILGINGSVILDLGFTEKSQRQSFIERALKIDVNAEVHYLHAPSDLRRQRVEKRNLEKDPSVYSFDVTDMMFDFMEPKYEVPDEDELKFGCKVDTTDA